MNSIKKYLFSFLILTVTSCVAYAQTNDLNGRRLVISDADPVFADRNFITITTAPSNLLNTNYSLELPCSLGSGGANYLFTDRVGDGVLSWTSAGDIAWVLTGNGGTTAGTNFIGTTDAVDLVIKTSANERIRIESDGDVGIGVTNPGTRLEVGATGIATLSATSSTTDEHYAIKGITSGSGAGSNIIGVWGNASNTASSNTGSIGVLAEGNANTTSGQTNIALQVVDGEFTMGRTTQSSSVSTDTIQVINSATAGTTYTAQGPSGVIDFSDIGEDLDDSCSNDDDDDDDDDDNDDDGSTGKGIHLATLTINNRYASTSSIILLQVLDKVDGTSSQAAQALDVNQIYVVTNVVNRANGSFTVQINLGSCCGKSPTFDRSASTASARDHIIFGYMIVNPSR